MSARDIDHSELREAEITKLTRKSFESARALIVAGDKRATTEACNSLLEYLVGSADMMALVLVALTCSSDVAGKTLADLLVKVMLADAETSAEAEVARAEKHAASEPDDIQPTTKQALQLERMQV